MNNEGEISFVKLVRDENQNDLPAELRVRAKYNRQTEHFDYFAEARCRLTDGKSKTDAVPATLRLEDASGGMTAVGLTQQIARYEEKYLKIITLVLNDCGDNRRDPKSATKYGESRKALKNVSSQKSD